MPKRHIAWIVIVAMIALLMWWLPQTIAGPDSVLKAFGSLVDARAQILKRYVDKVDDAELIRQAVDAGIRAMIQDLGDPHATYLNSTQYKQFQERTAGHYGGIGVQVWASKKGLEVLSREPNSPALRAGILPGDVITQIDGRPTRGVSLVEAVHTMLNGPRDSEVRLTVVTAAHPPRTITLFRAVIQLNPVRGWLRSPGGGWRYMIDPELGIGYLRLVRFSPDVDERMDEVINQLRRQHLRALILDLRENPGGLLDSAREVADKFLDHGLIVRTSGRRSDGKQWFAMRAGTYPPFPMVVLVNGSTASAAEIVAGSLHDHKRAVVVGEQTYGKGSVQEVVELRYNKGAIKLTTAYYYLPNGQCIQRTAKAQKDGSWGVQPDVPVILNDQQRSQWIAAWRQMGRESDVQQENDQSPHKASSHLTQSIGADANAHQDAATALLQADLQLHTAFKYLQNRLNAQIVPASVTKSPGLGRVTFHRSDVSGSEL